MALPMLGFEQRKPPVEGFSAPCFNCFCKVTTMDFFNLARTPFKEEDLLAEPPPKKMEGAEVDLMGLW